MTSVNRFILFLLVSAFVACTPKTASVVEKPVAKKEKKPFINTSYYIESEGALVVTELDEDPVSNLGLWGFMEVVYGNIRYPANARRKSIAGTVIIQVSIDESGNFLGSEVKEGIGYGCDEETLRVVNLASENDFQPAIKDGKPISVRFDIPVKFKLE